MCMWTMSIKCNGHYIVSSRFWLMKLVNGMGLFQQVGKITENVSEIGRETT